MDGRCGRVRFRCVLGQLYSDYGAGVDALGLGMGYAYGFNAWGDSNDGTAEYRALTAMWRDIITARRAIAQ